MYKVVWIVVYLAEHFPSKKRDWIWLLENRPENRWQNIWLNLFAIWLKGFIVDLMKLASYPVISDPLGPVPLVWSGHPLPRSIFPRIRGCKRGGGGTCQPRRVPGDSTHVLWSASVCICSLSPLLHSQSHQPQRSPEEGVQATNMNTPYPAFLWIYE